MSLNTWTLNATVIVGGSALRSINFPLTEY